MNHKCIFFKRNKKIALIKVMNNQYELVKFKGNTFIELSGEKFWDWCLSELNYDLQKDKADFCFISDTNEFDLPKSLKTIKKSSWNLKEIEFFFKENEISQIIILKEDKYFIKLFFEDAFVFENEKENKTTFYIRTLPQSQIIPKSKAKEIISKSTLAQYYLNKTKKFKKANQNKFKIID